MRAVRWSAPTITKREKLIRLKAEEEAALPRFRLMLLQEFINDLHTDIYQYADMCCSRRSIEMTIGAMRIVANNLVKDFPKNKHAGLLCKMFHRLYDIVCIRLFDPLASRFDSVQYINDYVDEAYELMRSILQWHSVEDLPEF
jgi:hypothetical protein